MTQLQAALAAIDSAVVASESADVMKAKARGLIHGYAKRWENDPLLPLAVEQTMQAPLINPETGRKSRRFSLAGKIDVEALDTLNRHVIIDHKTCSEDITDPNAPYWRQLIVEGQPTMYMLLSHLNGHTAEYAIWDVVRKPCIAPRQVTKAERVDIDRTGLWFGRAAEPAERETLAMYEARLAWNCTEVRPEWYFARRSVARLDQHLLDLASDLWRDAEEIVRARKHPRTNPGACMMYGSPCRYLGICSDFDMPESENWTRKTQVHAELELAGDGRDVLTNSRLACLLTCRRKHHYQYELGIVRADSEESDALSFGTLWHIGQEAYWKEKMNGSTNDRATEVRVEADTRQSTDEGQGPAQPPHLAHGRGMGQDFTGGASAEPGVHSDSW